MRWFYARLTCVHLVSIVVLLTLTGSTAGQDTGAPRASAAAAPVALATPADPRPAQIRALASGTLDVSLSPQSLFDVPLHDEAALQVEAARVRALLRASDEAAGAVEPPARSGVKRPASGGSDAGSLRADIAALDIVLWTQRIELDRARLSFYELDVERRAELLNAHAARQEAARPRETEDQRRAREGAEERARALEAARTARSEAERAVAEELARLATLETRLRELRGEFRHARTQFGLRRDIVLGWQRRARDAKTSGASNADAMYDALRRTLRTTRDELSTALDALHSSRSSIPVLASDPLVDVPPDIPTEVVRSRREALGKAITEATRDEEALRAERAAALLEEVTALNRERLGLLPSLSSSKRDAITGFTSVGWDQAGAELRQLSLVFRYHQHVVGTWLSTVRSEGTRRMSPWRVGAVLVPVLVILVAILWGRRWTHSLLRSGENRLAAADRAERRTTASASLRAVRIMLKIHRPLEWILAFVTVYWMLPSGVRNLLEVQLLASVVGWSLAGALIVHTINALAAENSVSVLSIDEARTGELRLRSLRLVGATIITFILVLVISVRLVGKGTIYDWVFSTCWFAAIPIFLLLVRWWRETVFDRLSRLRKKTQLQVWILANRSGWKSFAAAMMGAVQLFTAGALKLIRSWLSGFDLARRIHAYVFKREIERIGEGHAHAGLVPLPDDALARLHPELPFRTWLSCPADELRNALIERGGVRLGGLTVVVGSRGMGKSSLLRAVAEHAPASRLIECHAETSLSELRVALDQKPTVMLIDDAHTWIEARIGGFAKFDDVIAFARAQSSDITWVFAVDASVWPLLKRARDTRPMFESTHILSPWNEDQLGSLITDRCQAAGVVPQYDALIERLPPGADEIDRQDALTAKQAGYERMLWDHVGGNPGLALQAWRVSLGQDDAGTVHVRPLQVPDMTKLERLPDASLFVLRAVLQLAPASVDALVEATRVRPDEVLQNLQFGQAQGFYEELGGRVRIAWPWLRAVTRLLERRHLQVKP